MKIKVMLFEYSHVKAMLGKKYFTQVSLAQFVECLEKQLQRMDEMGCKIISIGFDAGTYSDSTPKALITYEDYRV